MVGFNKGDMKGVENLVCGGIPQPVSLRVRSIPYKDAWDRTMKDLGVVSSNEGKGATPDFM